MSRLKRTNWSPNGITQKSKSLKILKQNEVTDGQGSQHSTGKALVTKAEKPRHPACISKPVLLLKEVLGEFLSSYRQ